MNLPEAYSRLRQNFGTHGAAAKELGISQQHYNALRNGRAHMPSRTAAYIIMLAQASSRKQQEASLPEQSLHVTDSSASLPSAPGPVSSGETAE